jgi:hypothetical protein
MEPVQPVAPRGAVRRITPLVLAALALVPAAAAKYPVSGNVCGAQRCVTLDGPGTLYQALRWEGTFRIVGAPQPAPFYTLTFSAPDPGGFRWRLVYAPARRVVRVDDRAATPPELGPPGRPYWRTLGRRQMRLLSGAIRDLEPFPPSRRWRPPR